ncbi:MAG: hypothetical protein LBJ43_05805, partial [Propionibacteriaceae bacterium]|nr:hypothetical protein [Propionibacteriaceae bacterium]
MAVQQARRRWRPSPLGKRFLTLSVASGLLLGFGLAMLLMPTQYVIWAPGQVIDLYAPAETPVIAVKGATLYPVTGRLLVTPVSVTASDVTVSLMDAVTTFLMDDREVFPREVSYPVGEPVEQVQQEGVAVLSGARRTAVIVALREAGLSVQQAPLITSVVVSGPAYGRLMEDDIVSRIDGVEVHTAAEVDALIG